MKFLLLAAATLCAAGRSAGDTATITLADGSILHGKITAETLAVETLAGTVEIPLEKIASVECSAPLRQPRPNRPVLAMDFDSTPPEITGRHEFVPGREGAGKALRVAGLDVKAAEIPSEVFPHLEGTIEFWARIPEASETGLASRDGAHPALIELSGPVFGTRLLFTNNDGMGRGGLCGVAVSVGHYWIGFGSSSSGFPDIHSLYTNNDPAGWHHYAVTWSNHGLDLPGDAETANRTGRKPLRNNPSCAVFVDGRLVAAGVTKPETRAPLPAAPLALTLQKRYADDQRAWIMDYDDIKIWNTVKLEFDGVAPPPAPKAPKIHDPRLVYWNTFDSAGETRVAEVMKRPGDWRGGNLVNGKFGMALHTGGKADVLQFSVPSQPLIGKGCVEFWARIEPPDDVIPETARLCFFRMRDARLEYRANLGVAAFMENTVASSHDSWQPVRFSDVLGPDYRGWHHYALAWSDEGVDVGEGKRKLRSAIFIDGKPVSRETKDDPEDARPAFSSINTHEFFAMLAPAPNAADPHEGAPIPFAIDELKIWNYAKTKFNAPDEPEVSPNVEVRMGW